ncbi:hypothetical protein H9L39_05614 [Fusarium oxysporum f. sp. albedinis]|nr:hypothetical protein H9L39_05614 [Fusarium oxysporum f. sp. albedinis]
MQRNVRIDGASDKGAATTSGNVLRVRERQGGASEDNTYVQGSQIWEDGRGRTAPPGLGAD